MNAAMLVTVQAGQYLFNITGNMEGRRQETGKGNATAPCCLASPTSPRGGTGNEECLRYTLLLAESCTAVASTGPGHRAPTATLH